MGVKSIVRRIGEKTGDKVAQLSKLSPAQIVPLQSVRDMQTVRIFPSASASGVRLFSRHPVSSIAAASSPAAARSNTVFFMYSSPCPVCSGYNP